jgi:hypothetical protein
MFLHAEMETVIRQGLGFSLQSFNLTQRFKVFRCQLPKENQYFEENEEGETISSFKGKRGNLR